MAKIKMTIDTTVDRILIVKDGVIYDGSMAQKDEKQSACEYGRCRNCNLSMECAMLIHGKVMHKKKVKDDDKILSSYEKTKYNGD